MQEPGPRSSTLTVTTFRRPALSDAAAAHVLVGSCEGLDLNSPYAYILMCTHFAETSAVAEVDGVLRGFAAGYLKPSDPSVLFIWQVAVRRDGRGEGLGSGLLDEVVERALPHGVRYLEATITPSNEASWALFRGLARRRGVSWTELPLFQSSDFGAVAHEEERLLRIGPFPEPGDS